MTESKGFGGRFRSSIHQVERNSFRFPRRGKRNEFRLRRGKRNEFRSTNRDPTGQT
jgi:hypothetical protein